MRLFPVILVLSLVYGMPAHAAMKKTVLAAGCFWSMQKILDKAPGVTDTVVGYAGGTLENPTYQNYHDTDDGVVPHVEAVEVTYDDAQTNYAQLLNYYFHHIDPTDSRGQFCDFGVGYKPVIFSDSEEEKTVAQNVKDDIATELEKPVAVEIRDAGAFWPAEDYHQDYYLKNPMRYQAYSIGCGRDAKLKAVWKK